MINDFFLILMIKKFIITISKRFEYLRKKKKIVEKALTENSKEKLMDGTIKWNVNLQY